MRVAIVNDLGLARQVLRQLVLSVPGDTVAWMAPDGAEAVRLAAQDRPDVILMDLLMPVLDGVECTRRIMAASPCPILVVTSTVKGTFDKVYDAMSSGALDAVDTPVLGTAGDLTGGGELLTKIATIGKLTARTKRATGVHRALTPSTPSQQLRRHLREVPLLLAIGASTGGPRAIADVLAALGPTY